MAPDVAVAVATYRRPHLLRDLLDSIDGVDFPAPIPVVVVDNDPGRSAEVVVRERSRWRRLDLRYVVEPRPGIADARNTAVARCADFPRIAFVDDDETVGARWLRDLSEAMDASGACAVQGPVEYVFERPPADWILHGEFFPVGRMADLQPMRHASTCNLLVDKSRLPRGVELVFDRRFGLTGGSDTMLTYQVTAAGGRIVWTVGGVVREYVPVVRTRLAWVTKRAFRTGNSIGRVRRACAAGRRARTERMRLAAAGAIRVAVGAPRCLLGVVLRRPALVGTGLRTSLRGCGMIAACLGVVYTEYGRGAADVTRGGRERSRSC